MALVIKRRIGERIVVTTPTGEELVLWVETLSQNKHKVRICFDDPNRHFNIRREELPYARHQEPEADEQDAYERVVDRHEQQESIADL